MPLLKKKKKEEPVKSKLPKKQVVEEEDEDENEEDLEEEDEDDEELEPETDYKNINNSLQTHQQKVNSNVQSKELAWISGCELAGNYFKYTIFANYRLGNVGEYI